MSDSDSIQWAPASLPMKRRRQTASVAFWLSLGPLIGSTMLVLLWYSWWFRVFMAAYLGWWLLLDADTPQRGGRPVSWLRGTWMAALTADYFPLNVYVAEPGSEGEEGAAPPLLPANTPPSKPLYPKDTPHLFCLHPHGIISVSWLGSLVLDARGMRGAMGLDLSVATVSANFRFPLWRDLLLGLGFVDASKASAAYLLSNRQNLGIVIGGAREALDAHPHRFDLTLNRRRGFCRLALQHGASLVPCISFGENELYSQVPNPPGSKVRAAQDAMIKLVGFTAPAVMGRGVFQYSLGVLPHRHPLHVVWGQPMPVAQVSNPTDEDISRVHAQYVQRLRSMYETYAPLFVADGGESTTPAVRERWWLARRAAAAAVPRPRSASVEREYESLLEDGDGAAGEEGEPPVEGGEGGVVGEGGEEEGTFIPPFRIVA